MSTKMGFGKWEMGCGGRQRRVALGFTILEIMISVLILGLGLLGLGALFPVVIRSQRLGADASYGAIAADAARAQLQNMDYESALPSQPLVPPPQRRNISWLPLPIREAGTVCLYPALPHQEVKVT